MNYKEVADRIPTMNYEELKLAFQDLIQDLPEGDERTIVSRVMSTVVEFTDYIEAPASTRFHLSIPHGLFKHSLGVAYRLMALDAAYGLIPEYRPHEIILSALLHDLGKAGQVRLSEGDQFTVSGKSYDVEQFVYYAKRELKTKPGQFEFKRSKDMVMMSIPMGGLHFIGTMLSDIWKPSLEVWQAIGYHDGQYVGEGSHVAHAECKLLVALHHADNFQARVERNWCNGQNWR